MFWIRAYSLRGEVRGGWALEFSSFLGPVKWERADRRVPFGARERVPLKFKEIAGFWIAGVLINWAYSRSFL